MAKKKNTPQKGGFNFYWIYGIVAVVIFMLMLTSSGGTGKKISENDFKELAENGLVKKLIIISNTESAEVYLKNDKIDDVRNLRTEWKNIKKQNDTPFAQSGPDFYFQTPPRESFDNTIKELKNKLEEKGPDYELNTEYEVRHDYFSEVLSWLFLPAILIFFWIFMMRRMGGGAGGGAGGAGGIFSIGKPILHLKMLQDWKVQKKKLKKLLTF